MSSTARLAVLALLLVACARNKPEYVPDLWDGLAYDQHLGIEQLKAAGWNCYGVSLNAEGIDGQCGPSGAPQYSLFGVPRAGGSVFLKNGQSLYLNTQLHGSSALFVAESLAYRLGKPQAAFAEDGTCKLLWRRDSATWLMYLGDGDPTKFVTLFTKPGGGEIVGIGQTSGVGWAKARLLRMPCAQF